MTPHQLLTLITGANRGIGKVVSRQLAVRGFVVRLTAAVVSASLEMEFQAQSGSRLQADWRERRLSCGPVNFS